MRFFWCALVVMVCSVALAGEGDSLFDFEEAKQQGDQQTEKQSLDKAPQAREVIRSHGQDVQAVQQSYVEKVRAIHRRYQKQLERQNRQTIQKLETLKKQRARDGEFEVAKAIDAKIKTLKNDPPVPKLPESFNRGPVKQNTGEDKPGDAIVRDVTSKIRWTHIGPVQKGTKLRITAEGKWNTFSELGMCGPEGYPAKAKSGTLTAKIGKRGQVVMIGKEKVLTVDQSGALYLGPWDKLLRDNVGSMKVTISRVKD